MPRKKRQESPTGYYHWICRGIHKKDLFHSSADYQFFKNLLLEYRNEFGIKIHHYCLMTNHVHLLVYSQALPDLSKFSQMLQRRYAYYYCGRYKWVGNVFQRGYRSVPVKKDTHLLECGRYIERNPLKAGLAGEPATYEHSSYRFYIGSTEDALIEPSPAYLELGHTDNERILSHADYVQAPRMGEEAVQTLGAPF